MLHQLKYYAIAFLNIRPSPSNTNPTARLQQSLGILSGEARFFFRSSSWRLKLLLFPQFQLAELTTYNSCLLRSTTHAYRTHKPRKYISILINNPSKRSPSSKPRFKLTKDRQIRLKPIEFHPESFMRLL